MDEIALLLEKLNEASAQGDIDQQFSWLEKLTNYYYQHNNINDLVKYLNAQLDLAIKTNRLDREMWALIAYRNLYKSMRNEPEELRCLERIHAIGEKLRRMGPDKLQFRDLFGKEASLILESYLKANDEALDRIRRNRSGYY